METRNRLSNFNCGRDMLNRYAYGLNNPVTLVDPDGKEAIVFIVGSGPHLDELAGHAAIWVTSESQRRLVSYGGMRLAREDPRGLSRRADGGRSEKHQTRRE